MYSLPKIVDARILIADDDKNCIRLLTHFLTRQGYPQCVGVFEPTRVIAQIQEFMPRLILLDWHMGDLCGSEVLQTLAAHESLRSIPVIVMTADSDPVTKRAALESGATDFLTKPFDYSEVILRIKNLLKLGEFHRHICSENERLEQMVQLRTVDLHNKIAELKVVQAQVIAEERMRAFATMAGGVVHDFNNNLMVIRGFSDLYSHSNVSELQAEDMRKGFEVISMAAFDASEIVRRLREFYRPPSNECDVRESISLNQMILDVVELSRPRWETQCGASGICISVNTDLHEVPEVHVSPSEIREVLLNLVFNAIDAMPQGGAITLRSTYERGVVKAQVIDTGMGMTEETRRRCLEPFFTTKGNRGTGLGLSIIYGIIKRHGGTLDLVSEVNRGTTAIFTLPPKVETAVSAGGDRHLRILRNLRILAVDDDPNVCAIVARFLDSDDHSVTVAGSGSEALERLNRADFDLVITDQVMPKMNGSQLAEAIRAVHPTKPIILLTGYENAPRPDAIDAVLCKPTTLDGLRDAISYVMTLPASDQPEESLSLDVEPLPEISGLTFYRRRGPEPMELSERSERAMPYERQAS